MQLPSELSPDHIQSPGTREEDFAIYWKILLIPVTATFAVFLYWNSRTETLGFWRETVLEAAMFLILTVIATYYQRLDRRQTMVLNAIAGIFLGLSVAVAHMVFHFKFYLVFGLLTDPVNIGILGVLMAWLISSFASRIELPAVSHPLRFLQKLVPHKH